MSPNPEQKSPQLYRQNVLSWLVGVATTATIGSFAFAWNTNVSVALLLERDREKTEKISAQQIAIDKLQLSNIDLTLKVNNLEQKVK